MINKAVTPKKAVIGISHIHRLVWGTTAVNASCAETINNKYRDVRICLRWIKYGTDLLIGCAVGLSARPKSVRYSIHRATYDMNIAIYSHRSTIVVPIPRSTNPLIITWVSQKEGWRTSNSGHGQHKNRHAKVSSEAFLSKRHELPLMLLLFSH